MSGFTKGPWRVDEGNANVIEDEEFGTINAPHPKYANAELFVASVWDDIPELAECAKANAHLIAAAPEMYDALHEIFCELNGLDGRQFKWIRKRCETVLAKARGE